MKKSKLDAHQALNTSNAERPLKLKIQELVDADTARLEAQPDRMHLLACKEHLGLGDWIEITGIGIGGESHYTISEESIRFIGWGDETIRSSPEHQQPNMIRQNEEPGLAFPCTPRALLDFVDSGAGRLTGSFLIPVEFRNAVDQIEQIPVRTAELGSGDLPLAVVDVEATPVTTPPPITRNILEVGVRVPVLTQQNIAILNWLENNNHSPKILPVPPSGKAGVKKVCRDSLCENSKQLFSSSSVFDTAWERLRACGEINDAKQ